MLDIYRPLYAEKNGEVIVYVNGKKKLLKLEPELHIAIKGLDKQQLGLIMKALNVLKKVKVGGVVTTVPFVIKNLMRDSSTSLIQSEAGINAIDLLNGYKSAATQDKWFKEWVAAGGATEYINVNNRRQAQKIEDDVFGYTLKEKVQSFTEALAEVKNNKNERTLSKLNNATLSLLEMPVDAIRDMVSISESGARIAEFRKAVEKGVDKETAAVWSRKLSVDLYYEICKSTAD
jgi:hypothetical protein